MPSKEDFNKRIKLLIVLVLFLALNIIALFVYSAISETAENKTEIIKGIETSASPDESNFIAVDNLDASSFAKVLSVPVSSRLSSGSSSHSSSSSSSNGKSCDGNCGIGSPDEECKDFGFDFGVAKWECEGSCCSGGSWKLDEESYPGTSVTGCCSNATWDAGNSGADGIIVKAGDIDHGGYFYAVNGTSGIVILSKDISHITFCGYEEEEECGNDIIEEGEECEHDSDCEDPICEDKCIGNDYYEYKATENDCDECSCEDNECEVKNISYNDQRCTEPRCGDGNVDAGEECDDGNLINGDGCDSNCMHEKECCEDGDCPDDFYSDKYCYNQDVYWNLTDYFCKDGNCLFNMSEIFVKDCGEDSCDDWGDYYCEGKNKTRERTCYDKGCSSGECFNDSDTEKQSEECAYGCVNGECTEPCGDGNLDAGEECDLGDNNGKECAPGYGETCTYCSATCENKTITDGYCGDETVQKGYEECEFDYQCNDYCIFSLCLGSMPNKCVNCRCEEAEKPYCGDGDVNQFWEQCDDGNNVNGDGCDENCEKEGCPCCIYIPFQFCIPFFCEDSCYDFDFPDCGEISGDCTTAVI